MGAPSSSMSCGSRATTRGRYLGASATGFAGEREGPEERRSAERVRLGHVLDPVVLEVHVEDGHRLGQRRERDHHVAAGQERGDGRAHAPRAGRPEVRNAVVPHVEVRQRLEAADHPVDPSQGVGRGRNVPQLPEHLEAVEGGFVGVEVEVW